MLLITVDKKRFRSLQALPNGTFFITEGSMGNKKFSLRILPPLDLSLYLFEDFASDLLSYRNTYSNTVNAFSSALEVLRNES